jgi:hypothetical protein
MRLHFFLAFILKTRDKTTLRFGKSCLITMAFHFPKTFLLEEDNTQNDKKSNPIETQGLEPTDLSLISSKIPQPSSQGLPLRPVACVYKNILSVEFFYHGRNF